MEPVWQIILTSGIASTVVAFVQFLITRHDNRKQKNDENIEHIKECLVGLGHDRIIYLGQKYIDRGSITRVEYENIHEYLYVPYRSLGGNGVAEKILHEVDKLPIKERGDEL